LTVSCFIEVLIGIREFSESVLTKNQLRISISCYLKTKGRLLLFSSSPSKMTTLKTFGSTKALQFTAVAMTVGVSIYILALRKRSKVESPQVNSETVPYDDRVVIPRWLGAKFDAVPKVAQHYPSLLTRLSPSSTIQIQESDDTEPSSPRPRATVADDADVLSNVFSVPTALTKSSASRAAAALSSTHAPSPLRPLKPITFLNHQRSQLNQAFNQSTPYSPAEH